MKQVELAARMGGRILESVLSYKDVSNLVYEGLDFHMDCIQIFPNMLEKAQEVRAGRDLPLCAVISYPHGTLLRNKRNSRFMMPLPLVQTRWKWLSIC